MKLQGIIQSDVESRFWIDADVGWYVTWLNSESRKKNFYEEGEE